MEIHGQHDDRALSDPASHRAILDAFGGLQSQLAKVASAAKAVRTARAELAEHRARIDAARKEADFLRHAVEELAALAPQPGEEAQLAERRSIMQQSEKVARELNEALDAVGGPHSGVPHISAALRKLERRAGQLPALIDPCVNALDAAMVALDEARAVLDAAVAETEFDPARPGAGGGAAVRAARRLAQIRRPADDLAALAERYAGEVATLDAGEAALEGWNRPAPRPRPTMPRRRTSSAPGAAGRPSSSTRP